MAANLPAAAAPAVTGRVFPGEAGQVRAARRFLAGLLDGCPAAGDALVCVSELATNADAPRGALSYSRRSREELEGGSWA
jgi:hypothetical protein